VRQCEVWGPLFLPAYLAASLVAIARGRDFYYGNRFELEAYNHPGNPIRRRRHLDDDDDEYESFFRIYGPHGPDDRSARR
jgi:hypothetical protein